MTFRWHATTVALAAAISFVLAGAAARFIPRPWSLVAAGVIGGTVGFLVPHLRRRHGRHRATEKEGADTGAGLDTIERSLRTEQIIAAWSNQARARMAWTGTAATNPRTGTATGESPGLEVVERDEPIKAWKQAAIVWTDEGYRFRPLNTHFGTYGADETAKCRNGGRTGQLMMTIHRQYMGGLDDLLEHRPFLHSAPSEGCTCGFYAVPDRPTPTFQLATLEVELFGEVIEHENGWRAGRQRVLAAWVGSKCQACFGPAEGFGFGLGLDPSVVADVLVPTCERHAGMRPFLTVSDVARTLGCEIRWEK